MATTAGRGLRHCTPPPAARRHRALYATPAPRPPTSGATASALRTIRPTPQDRGEERGSASRRSAGHCGPTRGREASARRPLATGSLGGPCWPPALPAYTGHPLMPVRPSCHSLGPEFSPFICVLRSSSTLPPLARSWHGVGCEQYGRLHHATPGGAPLTHPHTQNHAHDQERSARNRLPIVNSLSLTYDTDS